MYSYYDTEYLGAGHGLCAILQMILSVPGYIEQSYGKDDVKASVDFFLTLQSDLGNFPCAMDEVHPFRQRPEQQELVRCLEMWRMRMEKRPIEKRPRNLSWSGWQW